MSERPDLSLSAVEQTSFLGDALALGEAVAWAVRGEDGYPVVGLAHATLGDHAIVLDGDEPHDGAQACLIIERGATYDDIIAVVARGVVRRRALPLDDVVSFSFAKLGRRA